MKVLEFDRICKTLQMGKESFNYANPWYDSEEALPSIEESVAMLEKMSNEKEV
jgi:hypothetical protein